MGQAGSIVNHVEIVVVDAGIEHFRAGICKRVFYDEFGFARDEAQHFSIRVRIALAGADFVGKGDAIAFGRDAANAGADEWISAELAIGLIVELLQKADADLKEESAGFDVVIRDSRIVGAKFFDGAHDGVVEGGFVMIEPFAEEVVALISEARDDAIPIETRAAVIAFVRVGQKDCGFDEAVGDFGLREAGEVIIGDSDTEATKQRKIAKFQGFFQPPNCCSII